MIWVRVDMDSPQGPTIEASGHAGYAETGKDIVCAGVSTLMYTLARALEKLAGPMGAEISINGNGHAVIHLSRKAERYEKCAAVFQAITDGLEMLAEQYSSYVKIEFY